MKILFRYGKMICFDKKKKRVLSFSQWSFHTHICQQFIQCYTHIFDRFMFVSVKSPILVIHHYVLVLASKKKTRWETCSHSSENRFNHPSRTSHRFSHTGALSIGKIKKTIFPFFVRPSVRPSIGPFRFDFSSNDDHPIQKIPFCHLCFDIFSLKILWFDHKRSTSISMIESCPRFTMIYSAMILFITILYLIKSMKKNDILV